MDETKHLINTVKTVLQLVSIKSKTKPSPTERKHSPENITVKKEKHLIKYTTIINTLMIMISKEIVQVPLREDSIVRKISMSTTGFSVCIV